MGLMYSVMGIGGIFLQASINSLGSVAVAAVAAAGRFEGLLASVTGSIGSAVATFSAQNIGAGRLDRIKKGVKACVIIGLVYSITAFAVMLPFGRYMALIFIDARSTQLHGLTYQYMLILAACYWSLSLVHIVRPAIQGMGYSKVVFVAGLLEMVGRGAAGLLFVPRFGFIAVCFAAPAAWILADLFIIPAYVLIVRSVSKQTEDI
jgi:Na+-driven multidrug efflux pump